VKKLAAGLDMYRKVPNDLLEGTKRGSILSYGAITLMITLFTMETLSFLSAPVIKTNVSLDSNPDEKVRVNFNITMMDLKCDYAVIDVVSSLGTDQNVSQNVRKYSLDAVGVRELYAGRNKEQDDIILSDSLVTDTIEELHANGEDAVSLDATTLSAALEEHEFVFVDFYASWCSHCRDLAPTWETVAEVMYEAAAEKVGSYKHMVEGHDYNEEEYEEALKVELPVMIAKVDCVVHQAVCSTNEIFGYPTLRLFVEGQHYGDYHGDRTVVELTHWLTAQEEDFKEHLEPEKRKVVFADSLARQMMGHAETREEMNQNPLDDKKGEGTVSVEQNIKAEIKAESFRKREKFIWKDIDHPGCQLSGFLLLDRVPGHFNIQARSPSHDIASHMTNVSHEIHHLSFGNPVNAKRLDLTQPLTPDGFEHSLSPMDNNVYVNQNEHEAFHHYMKLVTTQFADPYEVVVRRHPVYYQILSSSQLSYYRNDIIPEAKFSYDLSPIAVYHQSEYEKRWYNYITSLMAIMGGVFTFIGLLENSINAVTTKKRL